MRFTIYRYAAVANVAAWTGTPDADDAPLAFRGDYATACALLIRRDNRRATLEHYSDALTVAAYLPGVAIWSYLIVQLLP